MRKIEKLKVRREHDGCHQMEDVYPSNIEVMRKVNELVDVVNKLMQKQEKIITVIEEELDETI